MAQLSLSINGHMSNALLQHQSDDLLVSSHAQDGWMDNDVQFSALLW